MEHIIHVIKTATLYELGAYLISPDNLLFGHVICLVYNKANISVTAFLSSVRKIRLAQSPHHMTNNAVAVTSHECRSATNYRQLDYLFSNLFMLWQRSKCQSFVLLTLCEEKTPVTSGFPSHRASNAESVSVSWRHHDRKVFRGPHLSIRIAEPLCRESTGND